MGKIRLYFDPNDVKDPRVREMLVESVSESAKPVNISNTTVQQDLVDVVMSNKQVFIEIDQEEDKPGWLQDVPCHHAKPENLLGSK